MKVKVKIRGAFMFFEFRSFRVFDFWIYYKAEFRLAMFLMNKIGKGKKNSEKLNTIKQKTFQKRWRTSW